MAYWLGKPVYLVNKLPIDYMSSWIFSCSEEIFDNFYGFIAGAGNFFKPEAPRFIFEGWSIWLFLYFETAPYPH